LDSRRQDVAHVQITLACVGGTYADGFLSHSDVHGIPVGLRVNGNRVDAHLFASPDHPYSNLSTIGNQYLVEHKISVEVNLFFINPA
jgi:hypothetical protein